MGFHCTKANPCVIMEENPKTNCCEYIAIYVDDLYITTQNPEDIVNTPRTKCKIKIQEM